MEEELLTATEVARLLHCSRSQVYALRESGSLLPRYKIYPGPKGWRWSTRDLQEFIRRSDTIANPNTLLPRPFVAVTIARELARKN